MKELTPYQLINNLLQGYSYITELEKKGLSNILNAIKDEYKTIVYYELERLTIFDEKAPNKAVMLERIQQIIINLADKMAKNIELDTKGKYLTNYESLLFKRMYAIHRIIDTQNSFIQPFIQKLKEKTYDVK